MELMFLILNEIICNSSCTVTYLTTDPSTSRQKAIYSIYLINEDDDNHYWTNHIEKYFNCLTENEFNNITYPKYFQNYEITISQSTTKCTIYIDNLNN